MAEEPDNIVLAISKGMRADMKSEFAHLNETLHDVRRNVASLDLRMESLDEKFEATK